MNWLVEIARAAQRLKGKVLRTPLYPSPYLGEMNGGKVFLKLESEQYTGSFKARGAMNMVLTAEPEQQEAGLITASTGNHAQGFARACEITGARGIIYVPETASASKIEAISKYPTELVLHPDDALQTELFAHNTADEQGLTWVSPYNHPMIIAGQGTVGMEIFEDLPDVDAVFVCVGGGGLMSGIAQWIKGKKPDTRIIGCQPENSPEMSLSAAAGEIVYLDQARETLSDGSAGGLEPGSITFDICRDLVDDYVLVSEDEIAQAIRWMVDHHHKIIEGAAGVALAAFMKTASEYEGQTIAIVICGSNITTDTLNSVLQQETSP